MLARTFKQLLTSTLAALALCACSASASASTKILNVELEGIADGDTIYVRDTNEQASYRVRFAMIDAPEKKQAYGMQSKQSLTQLLRGSGKIKLEVFSTDRYGRYVAMVFDERGRNINLLQVKSGAAWVYTQYAKGKAFAPYYNDFIQAQKEARSSKRGLWADENPLEPWKYRRGNR